MNGIKYLYNKKYKFDIICIDMLNNYDKNLLLLVLSWELLNYNGKIIVYNLDCHKFSNIELCPTFIVNTFIKIYKYNLILNKFDNYYIIEKLQIVKNDVYINRNLAIETLDVIFNKILHYLPNKDSYNFLYKKKVNIKWNLDNNMTNTKLNIMDLNSIDGIKIDNKEMNLKESVQNMEDNIIYKLLVKYNIENKNDLIEYSIYDINFLISKKKLKETPESIKYLDNYFKYFDFNKIFTKISNIFYKNKLIGNYKKIK